MDDPNKPTWEQIAADAQRKLRDLEEVMRGMTGRDFGNHRGRFLEPVRLREPVLPMTPEDQDILEAVFTALNVSGNPAIATPLGAGMTETPGFDPTPLDQAIHGDLLEPQVPDTTHLLAEQALRDDPIQTPRSPEITPAEATSSFQDEVDTYVAPEPQGPAVLPQFASEAQRAAPTEDLFPEAGRTAPPAPWPPGIGRPVTDAAERRQILAEARLEAERAARRQAGGDQVQQRMPEREAGQRAAGGDEPPRRMTTRMESADSYEPPRSTRRGDVSPGAGVVEPPPMEVGIGATGLGFVPDFGDSGQSFYQTPTTSQMNILSQAHEAVDATTNFTEVLMEVIRRLTALMTRNTESLYNLIDRLDAEEDTDEF